MLLIHPPVAKPGEPPPGLARLAYALKMRELPCRVWDANLEGILDLLHRPVSAGDTWTRRASAHRRDNIRALRSPEICGSPDRYRQTVLEVNRLLHMAGRQAGCHITLANYTDPRLSPVRSRDLMKAARRFEENLFYPFFKARLNGMMAGNKPSLVGFSVNFMSQALCAFAMAGFVRKTWPKAQIVLGGGLVTSWTHIPGFENPFYPLVDKLIAGPGEGFLISISGGEAEGAESTVGIDYSGFDLSAYLSPSRVIPYPASRGCYWQKCRFCPEKYERTPYQVFDKSAVCAEASGLVRKHGAGLIHFADNALSPSFLKELIRRPPGAAWYGFVRATSHLTDPGFVRRLKDSGCIMLKLGIESGDQNVLDALNKGIRLETVSAALRTIKSAGLGVYAYLLFGTPAESLESAQKTLSFTLAHAGCIDFLNLAVFNLPVLSGDARGLATREFYSADLSFYRGFVHPRGWHRRRVREFLGKQFKRPAPVRTILKQDPPYFTSNHAPFIVNPGAFPKKSVCR